MDQKPKSILVIDDEESVRKILTDVLDAAGYIVNTAPEGATGLKFALAYHPDLIILDLQMPEMDGLEALKKLRQDDWGKNADVIVLSNFDEPSRLDKALSLGVHDYLIKANWEVEDIVKKVKGRL